MKVNLYYILLTLFLFSCSPDKSSSESQESTSLSTLVSLNDTLPAPSLSMDSILYEFVDYNKNKIQQSIALASFFQELKKLKNGTSQQVHIAHIGDSHIQADFIPGKMRYLMQAKFGNAGRGLVFPYKQAGTHSPIDFKSDSKASFFEKRSVFKKGGPSIGISGMGIESKSANFDLSFYQKTRYGSLEGFNQVTIFHEPIDSLFEVKLEVEQQAFFFQKKNNPFQKVFQLNQPVVAANISVHKGRSEHLGFNFHGLLLENTLSPGILYNMMGVNGTTYFHFNRCEYFLPELSVLNPSLIIISLGTNEALTRNFKVADLEREARKFIRNLKESCPQSSILITTLPEAWQKKEAPNPHVAIARQSLIKLAREFEIAWWDLYEVMGGHGVMKDWVDAQLGYVDYIHFTQKGYELQADLLYTALIEAYNEYR